MSILADLSCLFEQIPASFWGVVFGSILSLGGVALTNRASDRRLLAQFDHERLQKTKERGMALRKEVFLAAAEAIAAGMNAIGRFANFDLPNDQVTADYVAKAPAIAKVHVIARAETVKAMVGFTGELGALFMKLFARRFELMGEKSAITLIDNQVAEFGKERDRVLEMIKQHNIEGTVNERRWNVLQGDFEFEQKRVSEALARRAELVGALQPKHLAFMRECVDHTASLGKLLVPVLSAVRAELELEFDDQTYSMLLDDSVAKQQHAIDEFIKKFMPAAAQPALRGDRLPAEPAGSPSAPPPGGPSS